MSHMWKKMIASLKGILQTKSMTRFVDFVVRTQVQNTESLVFNSHILNFTHPNPQIRSRNETFATKEPETLAWIETFQEGEILWDVGANVGLYSVYAAKRGCRVIAFEPSVFNLEFLVRNVCLNDVADRVSVAALALGGISPGFSMLKMSSTAWGDSQHNFGGSESRDGVADGSQIKYQVLGLPLDSVSGMLHLNYPNHIKIDVDGIEPEILESGPKTLEQVSSVLVETPLYGGASERISTALTRAGLRITVTQRQNQIWTRRQ